ncbi:Uncharacterised protein [Escherichia coli]|uniref:Uncharacterized protein n=1 Tax=Escherichia coli TaxID=562 RepID=A0A484YWR9_ECOLX|nr:Uncharacterised protein [Escherichia coli]
MRSFPQNNTAQNVLTHTMETYVDSGKYKNWIARVKKLIEDSYGKESDYYNDFNTVNSRVVF